MKSMSNEQFAEEIVANVKADYERRAQARRGFESQWQLNTNFVMGNQYCYVNVKGEVEDSEKDYFWQEREVFNHIASILESRLAKLSTVRPKFIVRPASGDDKDVKTAKVTAKILESSAQNLNLDDILTKGTMWAELTGSAFYKVVWDTNAGMCVGNDGKKKIKEGDVRIDVCSPYEIFPNDLGCTSIEECSSIIHAKALHVDDVYRIWGKKVNGEGALAMSYDVPAFCGGLGLSSAIVKAGGGEKADYVTVIERYEKPNAEHSKGRLTIVAGNELLYYGEYEGDDKTFYPFVRQISVENTGCFYGTSMVERCIPIQRAYNAVKNRKHEFLNRIAMGVLMVEDGSVDTVDLEEDGLSPGKILVYRQGSTPPSFMSPGHVPEAFNVEETRLLNEFVDISGISEIMRSSSVPSSVTSGSAISMLIEQDDTRLNITIQNLRNASKTINEKMLNLYKENASYSRLCRFVGEDGEIELITWTKSDLSSDTIVFASTNELNNSIASKKNTMMELLRSGLLHDENGKLSSHVKHKILDVFGYGGWEETQTIRNLHQTRATKENVSAYEDEIKVCEIDDHDLHINEHIRFMLTSEFENEKRKNPKIEEIMLAHIREHKKFKQTQRAMEDEN